ncbi:hypothetical protein [Paenibacillus eucommiae]|uniref:Uncharacterized protein n=1 Tax=Paenibacillus eucommiae TaxID=1355755 RepID=A0ABS4IP20_9BACL|nr:hypothetical protein [Paenibacillus eucommiae]MBP1989322.1 hypothetical protein [Paenibacillus eucommiae]
MMNEQQKTNWRKKRELGRSKYLLFYGVLPWSLLLTLFFGTIEFITQGEIRIIWIPIRLIIFAIVGFFLANSSWYSKEKNFGAANPQAAREQK